MAAVSPRPSDLDDDLGSLLNYDLDLLDAPENDRTRSDTQKDQPTADTANGIGADEEIHIRKRRQPIAKLDDARLLSAAGIPKLRKIQKQKLKFKGKGHEFSDIARLLNMYQLWLDDLYPRAKFADALAIVEKLGHAKRMQMMRKQWIDEGRPKPVSSAQEHDVPSDRQLGHEPENHPPEEMAPTTAADDAAAASKLVQHPANIQSDGRDSIQNQGYSLTQGEPDMDELDALLETDAIAYGRIQAAAKGSSGRSLPEEDEFADEMEAMAGMDDPW